MTIQRIPAAESEGVELPDYRFHVKFIFSDHQAFIYDLKMKRGVLLLLHEPVTEENCEQRFAEILQDLIQSGQCRSDEKVLCTTFPAGSKLVFPGGKRGS